MTFKSSFVALGVVLALPSSGQAAVVKKAIPTTICILDAVPEKYEQKIVLIRARIEGFASYLGDDLFGFREGLFDENCPGHALHMAGAGVDSNQAQMSHFNKVIRGTYDGVVGTRNKAIRATIVGRFSTKETGGVQAYTLYPISITDIRVRYGEKSLIPTK